MSNIVQFALLLQCLIRRQTFSITRNIIDSRILTISQIKYRMVYVLRSFCGCDISKNCSQCIDVWNHDNCTIICLVCVVFKRFRSEFWLDVSIVLIDMIINQNIRNNIDLYTENILILECISCKLSANVMRTVVFSNGIVVDDITLLELLECLLNLLVDLSIMEECIMCCYAQKLSKLLCFNITYMMLKWSIQNHICKDMYSTPKHTQSKLDKLRQLYTSSVYDSCCTMIILCKTIQYYSYCQYYYQIFNGVCTVKILLPKVITHINTILTNTMHRSYI